MKPDRIGALLARLRALPVTIEPTRADRTWEDCGLLALRHRLTLHAATCPELAPRRGLSLAAIEKTLSRAAEAERTAFANPPA